MTEHRGSHRFLGIVMVVAVAMLALACRLVILHLGLTEKSRTDIGQTRKYRETLTVGRGRIIDGSPAGNILALNVNVKDIWVDPQTILASNKATEVTLCLARQLNLDPDPVASRVNRPKRRFEYIARYVPEDTAGQIARMKLVGVHFNDALKRTYPQGSFLCHVLGYANDEGVGAAGIEQKADKFLKGSPGLLETELDARRHELYLRRTRSVPPQEGADVTLTIDQHLQYMVEKALDSAVELNHARAAWAIMQRIKTGEILAMASRPCFDPGDVAHSTEEQRLNRAIGSIYEPGSTFKVAVIAAALNEGVVEPSTVFDCENGHWLYQKRILRDYHSYGRLCVADVLKKSSNIGAAKISLLLGDERLERYLRDFHIGSPFGIDLPGEEAGILHPVAKWSAISSSRIAIGQGVAVTALQMLGVMCAIANDGVVMRPYVIKEVIGNNGTALFRQGPQALGRPVRAETAALMRALLARTTEEGGTGTRAAIEGFKVAGKTGTAQKPVNGVYSETDYMASFVGFLPAEDPEIGLIVVIDEPQPLHTGGVVAAPVFAEVAGQAVRYLGISPPSYAMTSVQK